VADTADRAERGGRGSDIQIGERCFHLEGRQLGTEATEQPVEQEEESQEESLQTPPRRRSGRTWWSPTSQSSWSASC
jgi:hypothetical protein